MKIFVGIHLKFKQQLSLCFTNNMACTLNTATVVSIRAKISQVITTYSAIPNHATPTLF